ncbi:hypothetical protein EUGRSUZ_K01254 [Eucalyptus grandis]|uniref:Uncharacterized protein n=2 Tax=Eucalyptus grandis TaxID=71139 RepID=A0ACC3IT33_EUCGR|nr:hypothetical protein EUGRSUZ_K01254 [Eucalyptus grandis]
MTMKNPSLLLFRVAPLQCLHLQMCPSRETRVSPAVLSPNAVKFLHGERPSNLLSSFKASKLSARSAVRFMLRTLVRAASLFRSSSFLSSVFANDLCCKIPDLIAGLHASVS